MMVEFEIFEHWMNKLVERLDRQEKMIAALSGKEFREFQYLDGEKLLDNQDVCHILQTSKRSLQRYRSSGYLRYHLLRHKIYYKEGDVLEFLRVHFEEMGGSKLKKKQNRKKKKQE